MMLRGQRLNLRALMSRARAGRKGQGLPRSSTPKGLSAAPVPVPPPSAGPPRVSSRAAHRRLVVIPACVAFVVCSSGAIPRPVPKPKSHPVAANFICVPVVRGTLEHGLSEQGLLDSCRSFVVASECEWTVRILRLIPEGEWVEEGDVVVELDSSELIERLRTRQIQIINAAADLKLAREDLRLKELENESSIAQAELAQQLADLDLNKYLAGEFPRLRNEAEAAVALAQDDYNTAQARYEYSRRMTRKGYRNPTDTEKDWLAVLRYGHALDIARRDLELLTKYTIPRQLTELQATAAESQRELTRVKHQAELAMASQEMLVQNRLAQYQHHLDYAERLRKSIAACTIRAPRTGEIIYANEGSIRNEIVAGEYVRHRQDVVRIPDLSELEVDVRIHESQIAGVRVGLPATVALDAYPGRFFRGQVTALSQVPTAGSYYTRDLKEYDASIRIDAPPEELADLKPGLTAHVKIHLNRRDDCLYVPPQSVVDVLGHDIVFISTAEGVEAREVQIGMKAETGVEILSGLSEDEQVLLSPRTSCSEWLVALSEQFASETRAENIGG